MGQLHQNESYCGEMGNDAAGHYGFVPAAHLAGVATMEEYEHPLGVTSKEVGCGQTRSPGSGYSCRVPAQPRPLHGHGPEDMRKKECAAPHPEAPAAKRTHSLKSCGATICTSCDPHINWSQRDLTRGRPHRMATSNRRVLDYMVVFLSGWTGRCMVL